jgi:hypothetical protein
MNLDPYDLRARVVPALIVALPVSLAVVAWFPDRFIGWGILVGLLTGSGAYVLLAQLARDNGKRKEPQLFDSWNGKPTTRQLRHRDTTFDWVTLARYHTFLSGKVGVSAPTKQEEEQDPKSADDVFESYVHYLREATREKSKYPLVFSENVNYGFRRNLWGMKPAGILLALLGVSAGLSRLFLSLLTSEPVPMSAAVATVLCILLFVWWCLRVTPTWVRLAAEAYAERLLGTCTSLAATEDKKKEK